MNKNFLYNMFIWTFGALYLITAFISFYHAIEFFSIGNIKWMSILLAGVFEIGQATVLASLLLSENKKAIMPWVLMGVLTTVQVVGNVYSVFKYISESATNYYQYLEKPLLFWYDGLSQNTVMVIISYIIGALLPIVALCMTTMVANNIKLKNEDKNDIVPIEDDSNTTEIESSYEVIQDNIEENKNEIYENVENETDILNNALDDIKDDDMNTEIEFKDIPVDDNKSVLEPIENVKSPISNNRHRIKSVEFRE